MVKMRWAKRPRHTQAASPRKPTYDNEPGTFGPAGPVRHIGADGKPYSRVSFDGDKHPYRQRKHARSREVWIVIGADCPWNTTPGVRQVRHFPSPAAARKAGFPSSE